EAHDTTARTSLRLLAVLNVLSSTPARAKRLAPSPGGPLTHFASPRGEKCRLKGRVSCLVIRDPKTNTGGTAVAPGRLAPRPDVPLKHFALPSGEKSSMPRCSRSGL
ncbi:MAG: hypothetical protein OXH92_18540, partial [Bryobacterales bacterium]|nr:hypothetical protein [Bryobacterales bacterium]